MALESVIDSLELVDLHIKGLLVLTNMLHFAH